MQELSEECGVFSKQEPVLSLPLGTNEVTVSEVAKVYQTFFEGKTYRFYDRGPKNQINFIRRIEDRVGNILFEPQRIEKQVVSPEIAAQLRELLRKTVTHGTGRRARGELYVNLQTGKSGKARRAIPAFGKTGTTNDFITSYFAGLLPFPGEKNKPLSRLHGYAISTYVGYDRNRVMKKGRQRIYGGTGALPLWTDFAKSIIQKRNYQADNDTLDLTVLSKREWPFRYQPNLRPFLVDLPRGFVLREGSKGDMEMWGTTNISATGEVYQNIFRQDRKLSSVVYMPKWSSSVDSKLMPPIAFFSPSVKQDVPSKASKKASTSNDLMKKGASLKGQTSMQKLEGSEPDLEGGSETGSAELNEVEASSAARTLGELEESDTIIFN